MPTALTTTLHRVSGQPQKILRGLKFLIEEEVGLYYLCSKNKGADQLISCSATVQLICTSVFACAKYRFSHDAVHVVIALNINN